MTVATSSESNLSEFFRRTFTDPHCSRYVQWHNLVNVFIFLSCSTLALETIDVYTENYALAFDIVEFSSLAFFTIDYIGNLYYAKRRWQYFFSFWGLVDLLSIAPSFFMMLNLTALQGTKVLRLLRVIRVLRVLKLAREAMRQISAVDDENSNPIVANLRIYFIALFSVMMISSTLMYYVEGHLYSAEAIAHGQELLDVAAKVGGHEAAAFLPADPISGIVIPEDKRFFTSIPTAMWWTITTLTTTGYGDLYPVTVGGRIIAGITMLLGLVLFGILMNIIGKTIMVVLFGETMHGESAPSKTAPLGLGTLNQDSRKIAALLILAEEGVISHTRVTQLASLETKELELALAKI